MEYDLATAIVIQPLNQSVTCEMGSSIFAAMTQLKVMSTTSALMPTIPFNERTNGEKYLPWS